LLGIKIAYIFEGICFGVKTKKATGEEKKKSIN